MKPTSSSSSLDPPQPGISKPRQRMSRSQIYSYPSPQHPLRKTRSAPIDESTPGPQHLEHEYQMALAELREVTINALYRLGYTNPKPRSPEDIIVKPSLDMVLAARFADVERARHRIDEAHRKIQEALAIGQTWYNTPWPSDSEDEDDERINEIRQLWAKFETSKLAESKEKRGSGRQKRKCREAAEEANSISERPKRRKVVTLEDSPRSLSS